jgi:mono/diheme cytochrome c family protein
METKQTVTFTALPDDVIGHYQAELLLPEPGAWEWSIQSGLFPEAQPMPVLQVSGAGVVAGNAAENSGPVNGPSPAKGIFSTGTAGGLLGGLALLSLAGGAALLARSREKRIGMFAGAGLLVLSGALAFAFFSTVNSGVTAAPKPAAPEAATGGDTSSAQVGQQLFLAKGCVVCHVNTRAVQNAAEYSVQMGPNLSTYRNDPEYLHRFLKDPASVRPDIEMPDLGLSKVEIDALVAFINSD